MLVDSHCHLNYKGLAEQQGDVLDRARARGVTAMLNIATRESEWDDVLAAAEANDDVWASVGIHPHDADHHPDVDTAKLVERAAHPRVIGIGEPQERNGGFTVTQHLGAEALGHRPVAGRVVADFERVGALDARAPRPARIGRVAAIADEVAGVGLGGVVDHGGWA